MTSESFRSRVFQYIRDHPFLLDLNKIEQNNKLIEAFGITDEKTQALIKTYKSEYFNELEFARFDEQMRREREAKQETIDIDTPKKRVSRKYAKVMAKLQPYEKVVKCPHCPGLYANEVMRFVGFRGYKDRNGVCTLDIKGKIYEGEAHPPPIVPVTNINRDNLMRLTSKTKEELGSRFYLGILKYEVELMVLIFTLRQMGYENIALLMARGHGKTYIWAWTDQLRLKHFQYNIIMLSETNTRLKVGNWIYVWALRNNYLKDPEKFSRKSTYQHFEILNGNRMDIYKFSKEDVVGDHDAVLKCDDIVKRKWRERPTENEKMINHFQSNINYIIRAGFELTGTCKFEGDPIHHIISTIEDMIVIKQSPFIACEHGNRNEDGTYDPCEICRDLCLLAPEIHSYDSLIKKMYEDFEAWFAEMMQNPHPMKGGMVDEEECQYVKRPHWTDLQKICIGVDSTEADLDSTDMCGIVSCAMYKDTKLPEFVFIDADVRKMPFRNLYERNTHKLKSRGIIETISFFVEYYEKNYPNVQILIAIERAGGGLFIIKEARQSKISWFKYVISEVDKSKKGYAKASTYGIKHTKEKTGRVFSELRYPIKEGQVKFAENLFGSVFVRQVCTFPKGKYDDGVDAGGMAKDELLKRWTPPKPTDIKPRQVVLQEKVEAKAIEAFKEMAQPYLKDRKRAKLKNRYHRSLYR